MNGKRPTFFFFDKGKWKRLSEGPDHHVALIKLSKKS